MSITDDAPLVGSSTDPDERTRTPRKNLTAELMADANKVRFYLIYLKLFLKNH